MHEKTRRILDQLRERLQNGFFDGEFLHSERRLEQELGVSRGAVRTLLAILEQEKRIFRVPGKGMRINRAFYGNEKFRRFMTVIPSSAPRVAEEMAILAGIAEAASERAAEMVLFFDVRRGANLLEERLVNGAFDGLLFLEDFSEPAFRLAARLDIPALVANQENGERTLPAVLPDYRQIGRLAGRYLVERGHRDIGFIGGGSDRFIYKEMLAGIKGALYEDNLVLDRDFTLALDADTSPDAQRGRLRRMFRTASHRPDALIAGRDSRARMLYEICGELALRIPEDISVIGYDNLSWDEAATHRLTTIAQPAHETGRRALEMLFEARTAGRPPAICRLPGTLIERGSVRGPGKM